jgi:hypothetical protein
MEISQKTKDIARGNDIFRQDFSRERIVLTSGVDSSPYKEEIIQATKSFNSFNNSNDPYGEHNFGSFVVAGEKYFFKIDYYDNDFEFGADPYESSVYQRVLTIMRADEY